MVAKMILPLLGGTPNVWNTSLFFFQALLLAGYAYAHFASSWLGVKRHAILHLLIVASCVLALPIEVSHHAVPAADAPLFQLWSARSRSSVDPYILYAASNLGSMVGLIAYPLVVEPHLSL